MSQEEHRTKKEEEQPYLKSCEKCTKFFTNEQAFETHMKMKHEKEVRKEPQEQQGEQGSQEQQNEAENESNKKLSKNVPMRSRMVEMQRNELEDNIYTFLGQLGQKNVEPISSRAEIINFANDQKLTGQTNYSVNKVIRTPYEQPIRCSDEVPVEELERSKYHNFLKKLKDELKVLEGRIEDQKQLWELRDPMAPEEEVADEFSLMDIRKLILNYPKRRINLQYPGFSIFLLWLGRICKSPAFKEFFMILGQYLGNFSSSEGTKVKGDAIYDVWKNYHKNFEARKIDSESLGQLKIFDQKNCKKFVDYFVQWNDLFKSLSI